MENQQPKEKLGHKSNFRKCKMADGRHLEFRLWAIIWASIKIFALNLVQLWKKINNARLCVGQ